MNTRTLRCEICGGELQYSADGRAAKCLACGNEFWFKEEKSEALALALNRAGEKRRRNDFDSAIDEYRIVIGENPEDAEAHWGLVVSTYGIEYVEDYRTGKLIPTCRRAVPKESVLDNEDYKLAVKYAAPEQRAKYEKQAQEIDRLQQEIKNKIDGEEDYDVFISFKSTDDDRPTADRYIARRIYDELEKRGIKTFYSEETLRSRAFDDYEPIIFKALFSCKFFILVATNAAYIESAWVKNEWSRFRDRARDENLTNNCCAVFKNIKTSDLPAFIRKQGVDLSKYPAGGYEIELADNISVRLGKTKRQSEADEIRKQIEEQRRAFEESQKALEQKLAAASQTESAGPAAKGASATVRSLLLRAAQEREDGNFDKARDYYGKVLDADPENSDGWFGLFLCDNSAKAPDALGWISVCKADTFDSVIAANKTILGRFNERNYRNAEKYADENRRKELDAYKKSENDKYSAAEKSALDMFVQRGLSAVKNNEYQRGLEIFRRALKVSKALPHAWMGIVLAECKTADLTHAYVASDGDINGDTYLEYKKSNENVYKEIGGEHYDNALKYADKDDSERWQAQREALLGSYAAVCDRNLNALKLYVQKQMKNPARTDISMSDTKTAVKLYLEERGDDVDMLWAAALTYADAYTFEELLKGVSPQNYVANIAGNKYLSKLSEVAVGKERDEFKARMDKINAKVKNVNGMQKKALLRIRAGKEKEDLRLYEKDCVALAKKGVKFDSCFGDLIGCVAGFGLISFVVGIPCIIAGIGAGVPLLAIIPAVIYMLIFGSYAIVRIHTRKRRDQNRKAVRLYKKLIEYDELLFVEECLRTVVNGIVAGKSWGRNSKHDTVSLSIGLVWLQTVGKRDSIAKRRQDNELVRANQVVAEYDGKRFFAPCDGIVKYSKNCHTDARWEEEMICVIYKDKNKNANAGISEKVTISTIEEDENGANDIVRNNLFGIHTVTKCRFQNGNIVRSGDVLMTLRAQNGANTDIIATSTGLVTYLVNEGSLVNTGDLLLKIQEVADIPW